MDERANFINILEFLIKFYFLFIFFGKIINFGIKIHKFSYILIKD